MLLNNIGIPLGTLLPLYVLLGIHDIENINNNTRAVIRVDVVAGHIFTFVGPSW